MRMYARDTHACNARIAHVEQRSNLHVCAHASHIVLQKAYTHNRMLSLSAGDPCPWPPALPLAVAVSLWGPKSSPPGWQPRSMRSEGSS